MTLHHDHGPAVSPLSDDRRAALRTELLSAIHHSPEPRSSRTRAVLLTAAVATVAAALVAGPSLLAGDGPADGPVVLAAASAEGLIPSSTAPCIGAQLTSSSELDGATYLIDDSPLPLGDVRATVDECPYAWPLATYVEATGSPDDSALTLWGPEAEAGLSSVEALEGAYPTVLPGSRTSAWVVELPWGSWVEWSDETGDYIITAAGIDADTTIAAAVAYTETRDPEAVRALVPELQLVTLGPRRARTTTWYAEYGDMSIEPVEPTDMGPWLSLAVTVGDRPAPARASLGPIPSTGLTLPEAAMTEIRTGDNGGFRFATWTTATGADVLLTGSFTEDEMRAFAGQVHAVSPDDPRLDGLRASVASAAPHPS